MGKIIGSIFGGASGPDTSGLEKDNKRLRDEQLAEKRSLAQEKAGRRRRIASRRGALQFADTGATGLSKTLGAGSAQGAA